MLSQTLKDQAIELKNSQSNLVLEGLKPVTTVTGDYQEKLFSAWDIGMAMRDVHDMIEKTAVNFFVLGDVAKDIRDNIDNLPHTHIEIGMHKRSLTPEVKSLFRTWNFAETDYGYRY